MASRLGWAMEKMGWRMPAEEDEFVDAPVEGEVHEYPFSGLERGNSEPPFNAVRNREMVEKRVIVPDAAAERQRIVTVHPRSFADALAVGEAFRDGVPVIMNLTDMDDAEARRIIDFAAGLTFGLRGAIERVTTRVFLLSPEDLDVTHDRAPGRQNSYR